MKLYAGETQTDIGALDFKMAIAMGFPTKNPYGPFSLGNGRKISSTQLEGSMIGLLRSKLVLLKKLQTQRERCYAGTFRCSAICRCAGTNEELHYAADADNEERRSG